MRAQLRVGGFRVTPGRIQLLALLQKADKPLSIQGILALWKKGNTPDQTTLYRTLTDFVDAGIVWQDDLGTGVAHFEYAPDRPHHHHIICTDCGAVEDIEPCAAESLERTLTQTSKRFATIYSHSLKFFGHCNKCVPA